MNHKENVIEKQDCLARTFNRLLRELGIEPGRKAIKILYQELSGLRFTFPSLRDIERQARNEKIYNAWTGDNIYELSQRFSRSENQIRNIIKEELKRRRKAMQEKKL